MTSDPHATVIELIAGRWRSQILFVGTSLGVFDALEGAEARTAADVAGSLRVDETFLYRLLRALASLGLLTEEPERRFKNTAQGAALRADHPGSLRAMTMLEEGPVHYAAWRHLSDVVRSGIADGFQREFGTPYWDYLQRDRDYARAFSEAMSSYSAGEAPAVRHALRTRTFGGAILCDVGGGHGALLAELLQDHPAARGIVFDLPEVTATRSDAGAGEAFRHIDFVGGDMFEGVPTADVYLMKHILHDWSDADCLRILASLRRAAEPASRLFICELVVPGPAESHFAKLFDIHMMVVQDGRQRTADELASLLAETGWKATGLLPLEGSPMSIVEATVL